MSLNLPLVSIIIPTFNRAHLIGETLESVLAQTYSNWECIVVDDGSTDNTEAIMQTYLEKDKRFQYYHRPKQRLAGGNAARNYGFEKSKGKFIQWFDDDDIMLKNFIDLKVSNFDPNLDILISTGYKYEMNNGFSQKKIISLKSNPNLFSDYATWKLIILTPSVFFKKKYISSFPLFEETIQRGQETEFFSRLFFQLKPNQFKIINEPLFLYRIHNKTKTKKNSQYISNYKYSQSFVSLENMKRSIEIKDKQVFDYHYKAIISFLFAAIRNSDKKNAVYILKNLLPIIKKNNFFKYLEILSIGNLLINLNSGRYFFQKRWKKFNIHL